MKPPSPYFKITLIISGIALFSGIILTFIKQNDVDIPYDGQVFSKNADPGNLISNPINDPNVQKQNAVDRNQTIPSRSQAFGLDDPDASRFIDSEEWKYPVISTEVNGIATIFAANHAIVLFEQMPDSVTMEKLHSSGFLLREQLHGSTYRVEWNSDDPLSEFPSRMEQLLAIIEVKSVEPDYVINKVQSSGESLSWGSGLPITLIQSNGLRADGIRIAVLDSGINTSHEDLQGILFTNTGELINGSDSDGNGYIDDINGYDFVDLDNSPLDEDGHGTAVTGVIAATGNNGLGIFGLAQGTSILNVRILDKAGRGFATDAIRGIEYAIQFGCDLINCSWGGPNYSAALESAMEAYTNSGGLAIVAAGNDGADMSEYPNRFYPACFENDYMITVGSYNNTSNDRSSFSNYSAMFVDWFIQGENFLLPHLGNSGYLTMSGTSFSAPVMTSYLAIARAAEPGKSWETIINDFKLFTEPVAVLKGEARYSGRVLFGWYVDGTQMQLPSLGVQISDANPVFGDQITLTATGLNGHYGDLEWYFDPGHTILGSGEKVLTLTADHELLERSIYLRYTSYYGETTFGPVAITPTTEDLQLTQAFVNSFTFQLGDRVEIPAEVAGQEPITIKWYKEDGTFLSEQATYSVWQFAPHNMGGIYFVAENAVGRFKSPIIDLNWESFDLLESPYPDYDVRLRDSAYGNGIYLGRNWPDDRYAISYDGINWFEGPWFGKSQVYFQPVFFKGYFYTIADGEIYRSENGFVWEYVPIDNLPEIPTALYTAGDALLITKENSAVRTFDGTSWETIESYKYVGGLYYREGVDNQTYYSTDLVVWNLVQVIENNSTEPVGVHYIIYANGLFFGTSSNAYFCESSDGINWQDTGVEHISSGNYIIHHNGYFYIDRFGTFLIRNPSGEYSKFRYDESHIGVTFRELQNGQIVVFSNPNNQQEGNQKVYIEPIQLDNPPGSIEFLGLSDTNMILGDGLDFFFNVDEQDIVSLKFYLNGALDENRTSYPFYETWTIDNVGSFEAFAVLEEKDGTVHYSNTIDIEVSLPEQRFTLPDFRWEAVIVGNGNQLGVVYETELNSMPDGINWIKDLFGGSTPVEVTMPDNFDYWQIRRKQNDGTAYAIFTQNNGKEAQLNRLFTDGSITTNTIQSVGFPAIFEVSGDDLVMTTIDDAPSPTLRWLNYIDADTVIPAFQIPNSAWPYRKINGEWDGLDNPAGTFDYRVGEHRLLEYPNDRVIDFSDGREWDNLHEYAPLRAGNTYRNWLYLKPQEFSNDNGRLVHLDGRTAEFTIPAIDFYDNMDYYLAGNNWISDEIILWPRNEILVSTPPNEPYVSTEESGLFLNVPVQVRQLSIGPENPIPVSIDVYLSEDLDPALETSRYLGRQTKYLALEREINYIVNVKVPLPADVGAGTYKIGVICNPDEINFPDRQLNNLAWLEWTREASAELVLDDSPSGQIQILEPAQNYFWGDLVTLKFTPNQGYTFTGWGGQISGSDNPVTRIVGDRIFVRAITLPEELINWLPDTKLIGTQNGWHYSNGFGWFIGEHYPWIYNAELGWLNLVAFNSYDGAYLYQPNSGWIYWDAASGTITYLNNGQ